MLPSDPAVVLRTRNWPGFSRASVWIEPDQPPPICAASMLALSATPAATRLASPATLMLPACDLNSLPGDVSTSVNPCSVYPCSPSPRSEKHTSELQSLMRISYAVFCLKKKTHTNNTSHALSTITNLT